MTTKHKSINFTSKPLIIAILLITAGIIGFMSWIPFIIGDESYISYVIENSNMTEKQVKEGFLTFGIIGILLSIFAIIGGFFSLQRKKWKVVMISGVCGLFILGNYFLMSSLFCLIAIVLLIISKREFQ